MILKNLTTSSSILNTDISNNYIHTTTLSTLTTAVDDQFEKILLILMIK